MRHELIAAAALLAVTLGAQTVHGRGAASQGRPLPGAAGAPPNQQTPAPPPPPRTAPQTPPPSTAPPVIFPFPPLMRPPAGGLTPGFVFTPTDPTQPPPEVFRAPGPPPIGFPPSASFGFPFYAPFYSPSVASPPPPVRPATGLLRLSVTPSSAQVFVDSYFVGTIDAIEAQRVLTLEAGPHRIDIRAPEYQALTVDIRIVPYETVTYRGALERMRPAAAVPPAAAVSPNPIYVIPNCYIGNMPPRTGRLPSGCDIRQVQVLGPK